VSSHGSLPSSGSSSPRNSSHPGLTLPNNAATAGFASLLQATEDFAEEAEEAQQPESLNSPTKTSQDGQATELVANARRERKVQDLEITNASLEAINRTLERQLRKQTAELRRYQRLSRSGRLSLGPGGSRIPSGSAADGDDPAGAGSDLDDLTSEESDSDPEEAELQDLEDLAEAEENENDSSLSDSQTSVTKTLDTAAVRRK
jgi:hypothetical protein